MTWKKAVIYTLGFLCILGLISFTEEGVVSAKIHAASEEAQSMPPAPDLSLEDRGSVTCPLKRVPRRPDGWSPALRDDLSSSLEL